MPKYTKDELKAAFKKLADESGVPAETIAAFNTALDHDGFAAKVGSELVMTRSDYSRAMNDEVAPQKQLYAAKYNELVNQWYPQAKAANDKIAADAAAAAAKLAQYADLYGDLDEATPVGRGKVRLESGDVVSKSDFESKLAEREALIRQQVAGETIGVALQIQDLAYDHFEQFGRPLDTRPLVAKVKAARERGDEQYNLSTAYADEWGEKLQDKRTKAEQKRIDDAVQAARLDERSRLARGGSPAITDEESGPFFAAQALAKSGKAPSPEELEADFTRDLREANSAAASTNANAP